MTNNQQVLVRPSRDSDVEAMLAIYRHHIRRGIEDGVDDSGTPEPEDLAIGARTYAITVCRIWWPLMAARWWATPM